MTILLRDPSSWLQAADGEWDYPVSREWIVGTHTYDLHAAVNSKKPKPYPKPWPDENVNKIGSKKTQDRAAVMARLEHMNPQEENNG